MNRTTHIYERELRNHQRKLKRQRELRRVCILTGMSAVLVLVLALSGHALSSHANTELENISYKYYTSVQIKPGETLWNLAERYADKAHYVSRDQYIAEVMYMNHLSSEDIYAGDYLILPYYSEEFVR